MYCHNFHVVLSDGDFFFARSSMSCPWVISHMMTMSPNPISLFHRDLFYVFGDVCLYSAVSRWVSCYVARHLCDMSWSGVLVMILLFSHIFILIGKYHVLSMYYDETIHNWRLWWLPSSAVCGIFSTTSILVLSFGLHQWIQLVDRISMYLAQLAFCSDCREVARQRFLSMFSHSSP